MAGTRLPRALDLGALSPEEAFAVLGNEIRLEVVRVLWEAGAAHEYDDLTDDAHTIPFTTLRRRVDVDDNGRFNYHLSKLTPHFVRRTDDGYRLSVAGRRIARTVIAVSGAESIDLSADLEAPCPLCGAPLSATYEEQWFRVECTSCDGLFGDEAPDAAVFYTTHPAASVRNREPAAAVAVELYRCMLDNASMMHDVCSECAGPVAATVTVCDDHGTRGDEPCATCGTRFRVWTELRCEVCEFAKRLPVEAFVMGLTPVIAFLHEDGFDVLALSFDELVYLMLERFETTVVDDPFRVTVSIAGSDGTLDVSLDDDMNVVDVERRPSA